jgi:O-antigen ligase
MLSRYFPLSRHRILPVLAVALIAICIMLGGASRLDLVAPVVPRLAAIGVIGWIGWTALPAVARVAKPVWWLWIGLFALPLMQLVPLPWSLWTALPGRELARDIYVSVGEQPWAPISLTPSRTLNGLFALLPALAAFLLAIRLDVSGRDLVLRTIAIFAVASAMLGLLQVAAGAESALYFYAITNSDSGVGWFSNANHNSLMLCSGIVCVIYWISGELRDARRLPWSRITTALAAIAVLMACLPTTASRAGVLLSLVALGGGALLVPRQRIGVSRKQFALGAGAGIVILLAVLVTAGYDQIFGSDGAAGVLTDGRAGKVRDFLVIGWQYFPLGSGLGSFDPVYRMFESVETIQLNYLNNAHNEPAQIMIEAGVFGIALMLGFAIWFGDSGWKAWRKSATDALQSRQARAASLILAMLIAHSLVDYPLRTAALSAIFAFCAGILAVRPLIVSGKGRGLALSAWAEAQKQPDLTFPTMAERHMTAA